MMIFSKKAQDPTDLIMTESFFQINQLRTFTAKSGKPEEHEENNLYVHQGKLLIFFQNTR